MIASQHQADIQECAAEIQWPASRTLLRQLCQSHLPLAYGAVLKAYELEYTPTHTDLVISFGAEIAPLNVALTKQLHCRNILIGSLCGINPRHTTAHLSLKGGSHRNAIATVIAPTTISPERCNHEGNHLKQRLGNGRYWSCFIGGEGSGYRYCENDWRQLANGLNHLAEQHGIQWLLITSPRTGATAEDFLLKHLDVVHVARTCFYSLTGEEDITPILGCSERTFCTTDSLTMLSKVISSGRPAVGLQPKRLIPSARHLNAINTFCDEKYLQLVNIAELEEWQPTLDCQGLDYASYRNRIIEPLQQWASF